MADATAGTTIGRLLLEDAVPPTLHGALGVLDKKGQTALFQLLAEQHPDLYRKVAKSLSDVALRGAYESGGYSFGPHHLRADPATEQLRANLKEQVRQILADGSLTEKQRNDRLVHVSLEAMTPLEEAALKGGLAAGNPIAMQVASGAKGRPENFKSLVAGDTLYQDANYNSVPIPVTNSFYEGLTPAQFYAGTFGARLAIVNTKLGTAAGGWAAKRLGSSAHRLVVTAKDRDQGTPEEEAARPVRGLEVPIGDPDNEGALLAKSTGDYPANTVLTRHVLDALRKQGVKDLLVRSPMVGGPPDGGVYAHDVGVRERGRIAPVGDYVGLTAAQSLCLAAGTLVRMASGGSKPIEAIRPGDQVLGADITGKLKPTTVTHLFDNGMQECHETVFRRGTGRASSLLRVCSTVGHKILAVVTRGGRRPAATIRPIARPLSADRYYAKIGVEYDDTGHRDEPFALAIGLLIGDGCYTGNLTSNGIGFSCHDPLLVSDTEDYFTTLELRLVPQTTGGEYRVSSVHGSGPRCGGSINDIRNPMRRYLVAEGLWGQYSYQKTLPADVWQWSNTSVASLIGGLLATDGYVIANDAGRVCVGFGSTSRVLVEGVRELLQIRFGVYCSAVRSHTKRREDGPDYRPMFVTTVNARASVERLAEVITVPGIKSRKLAELLSVTSEQHTKHIQERGRCGFVSQTAVGCRRVYDIAVDNADHLFVLDNGLIVSNSEPMTQSLVASKHSGGVAGKSQSQQGFPVLDRLISIPSRFPGGAAHAQKDGLVTSIREAPQGGRYVIVDGEEHYAPPEQEVLVKPGDHVEAGDPLTDGIPNPAELVTHKGIGEGRRRFVETFDRIARNSGFRPHRRNLELLARGLIDHVRLDTEVGDHVPGDVVSYTALEHAYEPRPGAKQLSPKDALGQHLEIPVLHYSIGTRITPSMLPRFETHGIKTVTAHATPPPFTPLMIRSHDVIGQDPDWLARGLGSNQEKGLLRGVHRGDVSDPYGTSFVPALAQGTDFGTKGKTVGWKADG